MSNSLRPLSAHWPTEIAWHHVLRSGKQVLKGPARSLIAYSPDRISAAFYALRKYRYTFGRYPNVLAPRTFNEKIQARKIFDRRNLFCTWVDKIAVRDYVAARSNLGSLPKLHYVTTNPDSIPFDTLPQRYVVKASHGSGWVQVVKDNATVDRSSLIQQCWRWLGMNYFCENGELVYKNVPPRILIEEFLDNGDGYVAEDYKLYVFDGVVRFIQVDVARFNDHRRSIYDTDWNLIPVQLTVDRYHGDVPRPRLLDRMIHYAQDLAGTIDFVRVDLYEVGDEVYFGEMTPISGNGFNKFTPVIYDELFGSFWNMRMR